LLESPIPGGNLGPTFSCLIAENFATVKQNDRFFYELGGQPHSFNPGGTNSLSEAVDSKFITEIFSGQLAEIRKASMARIFCDNSDGTITAVQPKAFLPVDRM
jgi:peroxidase